MEALAVQAFLNAEWQDIALTQSPGDEQGDWFTIQIDYLTGCVIDFLERDDYYAVSFNYPTSFYFEGHGNPEWLKFIDDIIPNGAGRCYWVNFLDISEFSQSQQSFILLEFDTMSPVGDLRIRDSMPDRDSLASDRTFSVTDVMNHASGFLDYGQE